MTHGPWPLVQSLGTDQTFRPSFSSPFPAQAGPGSQGTSLRLPWPLAKPSPCCPLGSQSQRGRDCSAPSPGLFSLLHLFSDSHWSFQDPE